MSELQYGKLKATLPDSWKGFSEKAFKVFGKMLAKKRTVADAELNVLYHLLPMRWQWLFTHNIRNWRFQITHPKLSVENITYMRQKLEFITEEPAFPWIKIPTIKNRYLQEFIGPATALSNVTVAEFFCAERHFLAFMKNYAVKDLDMLVATLYRSADKSLSKTEGIAKGDTRIKFNENLVRLNAKKISTVKLGTKYAILYNYKAVRNFLLKQFPECFTPGDTKPNPSTIASERLIVTVARHRHMHPDVVSEMQVMTFFLDIQTNIQETEK